MIAAVMSVAITATFGYTTSVALAENAQFEDSANASSGDSSSSHSGSSDEIDDLLDETVGVTRELPVAPSQFRSAAVRQRSGEANGVLLLSSQGELYTLDTQTKAITPAPPYLPAIRNKGNGRDRSADVSERKTSAACRTSRYDRVDDRFCYFNWGVNYNALGVGKDGTLYATLKIGSAGIMKADRKTKSSVPLFQVYRLISGASEWEKFGPEIDFPYVKQNGGSQLNDLVFAGGGVSPDGTYYLSVTDTEGVRDKALVSHLYKATESGFVKVGDVRDENYGSGDTSGNDGDLVFTESGDLVMGFAVNLTDDNQKKIVGHNRLDLALVQKESLAGAQGGSLKSVPLPSRKIREGKALGEDNSRLGPVNGFSIGGDGSMVTSHLSENDSSSWFSRAVGDNSIPTVLRSMPKQGQLGKYSNVNALPGWEPPLASWVPQKDNSGKLYYQPLPWNSQITDMAGKFSITSVTVHKHLKGRSSSSDQFKIEVLSQGVTKSASTTGSSTDVTTESVPAIPGGQVALSEEAIGNASLSNYSVEILCSDRNGGPVTVPKPTIQDNKASVNLKIPQVSGNINCIFTNTPLNNGQFEWAKVNSKDELLSGSVWIISREDGNPLAIDGLVGNQISATVQDGGNIDKDKAQGKFLLKGLAPGKYNLKEETAPNGYKKTAAVFSFTIEPTVQDPSQVRLDSEDNDIVSNQSGHHNAVINQPITGELIFQKRAGEAPGSGNESLLGGSEWKLVNKDTGSSIEIADCVSADQKSCQKTSKDIDSRSGIFRISGLELGRYELIETKAPAGYILDTTSHSFQLDAGSPLKKFEGRNSLYNKQAAGPSIPLTGGIGRDFYAILGGGVLGLAVLILISRKRKQI